MTIENVVISDVLRFPNDTECLIVGDYEVITKLSNDTSVRSLYLSKQKNSRCYKNLYVLKTYAVVRNAYFEANADVKDFEEFYEELEILKRIRHQNVMSAEQFLFEKNHPNAAFIAFKFAEFGSIMDFQARPGIDGPLFICPVTNGPLGEAFACRAMKDILQGLAYLHEHNIVHRDLKPSNILLTKDKQVQIADFGCSTIISGTSIDFYETISTSMSRIKKRGIVDDTKGTYIFWAPEICCDSDVYGNENNGRYDAFAADIWSAGLCLWVFLNGTLPYWGEEPLEIFDKINRGILKSSKGSHEVKLFLLEILTDKHIERLTAEECLQHPLFNKNYSEMNITDLLPLLKSPKIVSKVKAWAQRSREKVSRRQEDLLQQLEIKLKNEQKAYADYYQQSLRALDINPPLKSFSDDYEQTTSTVHDINTKMLSNHNQCCAVS